MAVTVAVTLAVTVAVTVAGGGEEMKAWAGGKD